MPDQRIWRRPKGDPDANAWHALRVGIVIFILLLMGLPAAFA